MPPLFSSPRTIFTLAILLRAILLFYGLFQDVHSPMKYTDIDYFVFTDAARFVSRGRSPYDRDTYRYTPLLAWLLLPTTWGHGAGGSLWFSFGKVVFAAGDIVAGWLMVLVLRSTMGMRTERALKFASIWLLNPMVATISTRGSSEGLLGVMVMALLWAVMRRRIRTAGVLLGLAVHFKIYPFIYAPSIVWYLDDESNVPFANRTPPESDCQKPTSPSLFLSRLFAQIRAFLTPARLTLTLVSLLTFTLLNASMYALYGHPFLQHTYLHHLTRIDHRHNFSPYNTLLYLSHSQSSPHSYPPTTSTSTSTSTPHAPVVGDLHGLRIESLAFIPQLFLSALLIPLALAKRDLPSTMLAQTFAFVAFNKVCTSQYFLWYMVFLPFYLPRSSLLPKPYLGVGAGVLWVVAQALWLQQGYQLEFLGKSTFMPGLWVSSLLFFLVNVWILGIIISDVGRQDIPSDVPSIDSRQSKNIADSR